MDYRDVMKDAWEITRRTRALWVLGAISAAQAMVYSVVMAMILVPIAVLPQMSTSLTLVSQGVDSDASPFGAVALLLANGSRAVVSHMPEIIAIIVVVFAVWIVLGVLDVAAQPAMIAVSLGRIEGRDVSVSEALRTGFGLWGRTVGLLTVAALPLLALVFGIAVSTTFMYTLPIMRGVVPGPAPALAMQLAFAPLQAAVSLMTVALSVVVTIALRHALVEAVQVREALRRGWRLVRSNFAAIAVTYLVASSAAVLVALTLGVGVALLGGVAAVILTGSTLIAMKSLGTVAASIALAGVSLAACIGFAFQAALYAWTSTVWTLAWRNLTGRDETSVALGAVRADATGTSGVGLWAGEGNHKGAGRTTFDQG